MLHCAALHLFASRSWFAPPLRLALPCGTLRRRVKGLAQIRYGKRASESLGVDRFFRRERKRTRLVGKKRERVVVEFAANAGRIHPHEECGLVGREGDLAGRRVPTPLRRGWNPRPTVRNDGALAVGPRRARRARPTERDVCVFNGAIFERREEPFVAVNGRAGAHPSSDIASQCSLHSGDMRTPYLKRHEPPLPLFRRAELIERTGCDQRRRGRTRCGSAG